MIAILVFEPPCKFVLFSGGSAAHCLKNDQVDLQRLEGAMQVDVIALGDKVRIVVDAGANNTDEAGEEVVQGHRMVIDIWRTLSGDC